MPLIKNILPIRINVPQANSLLVVAVLVMLSACETTGVSGFGRDTEQSARTLAAEGRYNDAAGIYIGLAANATGESRDRLTLLAVEQWLFAGDGRRARSALSQVARPAGESALYPLWAADSAALALWEGRPDDALRRLGPVARRPLPARDRARIDALRGDAWFQKGEPLRATDLYLQRESWLDSDAAVSASRQRLWTGLQLADVNALRQAAAVSYDPTARGWLTLAALANSTGQQGIGWGNGVLRWTEMNPGHPAADLLDDLRLPEEELLNYPRTVAVLLPLTGRNANAGNAIKNGFLGAYVGATANTGTQQEVTLYDVNSAEGVRGAYERAVSEGAEFVVGPLVAQNVAALAGEFMLPVPVLGLNYLPDHVSAPAGFYQFALSPEDEAAAAAQRAIGEQGLRGVALVPATDRGRRVLASFATEFEGLGGNLIEYRSYEPLAQDFSFEIESLMGLTESVRRYDRLKANLGGRPLQFDPRRRQDIDFIFLYADAKVGRLIKSQLKFHYSGELPVYSTSYVYSMDGQSDADLDDLMFADAPWVIAPPARLANHRALYAEHWPAERRLARLHAMGHDAYHLVAQLFNRRERGMPDIDGASGQLFLTSDGRIHRRLAWARFENGQPVPLPDINEFQGEMTPDDMMLDTDVPVFEDEPSPD